jgi:hypothetical protein
MFERLFSEEIGPFLEARSFIGGAGRYDLASPTHWAVIEVHRDLADDAENPGTVGFTIKMLVVGRQAWTDAACLDPSLGARPTTRTTYGPWVAQTHVAGVPALREGWGGEEMWWNLADGHSSQRVATSVRSHLDEHVIPWLRQQIAVVAPS